MHEYLIDRLIIPSLGTGGPYPQQRCRAWQDCSIYKIVKIELDLLLAARKTNE